MYSSASSVSELCFNLLDGQPTWSESTTPTLKHIKDFLSTGCAIIETEISGAGYSIPVGAGTSVYTRVQHLETLYAAALAEMARTNITISPGERTRGQLFEQMFWDGLEKLIDGDLTKLGLSKSSSGKIYSGGISVSVKDTYDSDTDRVSPRFKRGQFRWTGTGRPSGSSEASSDDDEQN